MRHCWHFTVRQHAVWMQETGSAGAMLAIVAVALGVLGAVLEGAVARGGRLRPGPGRWAVAPLPGRAAAGVARTVRCLQAEASRAMRS